NDRLTRQRDLLASQALFVCRCPASSSAICLGADQVERGEKSLRRLRVAASCGGAKTPTSSSRRRATTKATCGQTGCEPEQAASPETRWQVGTLPHSHAASPCASK